MATLTLTLYLRSPAKRSYDDGLPLIELENGRRIIISPIEHGFDDGLGVATTTYELYRELSRGNRMPIGHCFGLDDVAKKLAEESAAPPTTLPRSYHFGNRR